MEITGIQTIAATRQKVWDALNDPDVLKKSLPGCESVERTSANEFKVIMAAAIGPLRARFNGMLKMSDIQAPESCTMVFEGQGGAVGFGKGNSSVKLTESHGQTELTYTADAQVGGKLAQVGSRLIDSVARKMADDFFKAFKVQLAGASTALNDAATAAAATAAAKDPAPQAGSPAIDRGPLDAIAGGRNAPTAPVSVAFPAGATPAVVPGWWLGIAVAIGSIATLAGVLFAR
jgi:carbon monoxide dehydrogenase subunit G